jgi:hypothetical protein
MPAVADPVPLHSLTLEQWAALDEDVEGELVDGELVQEELPSVLHEAIAAWLLTVLRLWVHPRGGIAFGAELKLALSKQRGRKADISALEVLEDAHAVILEGLEHVTDAEHVSAGEAIEVTDHDDIERLAGRSGQEAREPRALDHLPARDAVVLEGLTLEGRPGVGLDRLPGFALLHGAAIAVTFVRAEARVDRGPHRRPPRKGPARREAMASVCSLERQSAMAMGSSSFRIMSAST